MPSGNQSQLSRRAEQLKEYREWALLVSLLTQPQEIRAL